MRLSLAFFIIASLLLCFASSESLTESNSEVNATAAEYNNVSRERSKEDSFADMIDRALEKEFNESDQNEATDPGSFNNSVAGQQVQACGSMVTEEQPHAMLIPKEYFLMGYGMYNPCQFTNSPKSLLSLSCISQELLSSESMGLKLKSVKT